LTDGSKSGLPADAELPEGTELPEVEAIAPPTDVSRFEDTTGEGRRGRAARGTIVNSVFLIALNLLALFKGFAVAGFISVHEYGVWGLLVVVYASLYRLVQIGVVDKYIQQDHEDQEEAFQTAFSLQLLLSCFFVLLILVVMPLYAAAYGTWEILLPGWLLALAIPASAFQAPLWTFYRKMNYLQQRRLQVFDPVVSILVTLVLAAGGFGYWSLVLGTISGAWAAAFVAVRASPYKLGLRYERGTAKEYASYSGPLLFQGVCISVMAFVPVLVAQRSLGTAAVGAMAIANNISMYTTRVDQVVTNTIYPVICAVKDTRHLLHEAFLKSNRMGLLWAAPTGIGIGLFAPDLVHFVIGSRWESAIAVIQSFGIVAALNQIGFNWSAFYRALGDTRPIAIGALAMSLSVLGLAVPLLVLEGLTGYAIGMALSAATLVIVRLYYLNRLFPLGPTIVNVARGIYPAAIALAGTGAIRIALWGGERGEAQALAEVVTFCGLAAAVTLVSERALLSEFRGYLTRSKAAKAATSV